MFEKRILLSLSFVALFALTGCAHYSARPLYRISTAVPREQNYLSLACHIFSQSDCKHYLDRDVIAKGYQPIHITLTNNSNRSISFALANVSLPCASAEEIAQMVHTSTIKRAASYGIAGFFIWPFLIPAAFDSMCSLRANKRLDVDFARKALRDQIVHPFSTIHGLLFIPVEQFNLDFNITVHDLEHSQRFVLTPTNSYIQV